MKKIKSILSILIVLCMLLPTVVLPVSAGAETVETTGSVDAMEAISAAFDDTYLVESHSQTDDGYIGIPVDVHIYYSKKATAKSGYHGTTVIAYVVNTNTERIGTESDVDIMTRWLEKDWIVAVVDYKNNVRAASPGLESSVQDLRNKLIVKGSYLTASCFQSGTYQDNYVLPAGYDIRINDVFWEVDKHSAAGTMEEIVKFWNTDLKGAAPDVYLNWTYKDENGNTVRKEVTDDAVWYKDTAGNIDMENGVYTKVKYTVVDDITDCSNKDGTPLDLNLYMTFKYPTNPEHEVPVMAFHNWSGYIPQTPAYEGRPQFLGSIFNGYAGVIWDYLYNPICRDDGISFVSGGSTGGVTGDAVNYSVDLYNDKIINTAAMRYIRYVTLSEPETFKFDTDHIGVVGHSKSGTHPFLGEAILRAPLVDEETASGLSAEELDKSIDEKLNSFTAMRIFEGHSGESRYQNGETDSYTSETGVTIDAGELQPWLTYNGEELLSGAHFVYCSCPNCEEDLTEGHAPTFLAIQLNDGWWTPDYGTAGDYIRLCRTYNIPSVWVAVEDVHTLATGPDVTTNIDTYNAFRTFSDYVLKDTPVEALYTLPIDKSLDVSVTSDIIIKFAGEVYQEEIEKIEIKSESGDVLTGSWSSLFGDTEWTFKPDKAMKPGEKYTLTAPASLKGGNGKEMGEEYTSSFVTEAEAVTNATVDGFEITSTVPDIAEASKDGYINDMKLRFYVPTEGAANTAEVYAEDELLGSVPLKGKGHYSLDVSDYLEGKNAGDTVTFTIKQKREAGVFDHYEETYDSGKGDTTVLDRSDYEVTTFDSRSALKVWVDIDKCMYKKNPFYLSPSDLIKNDKLIENGRVLTAEDYGRRFNISLDVYDDSSRRIMMYTASCDTPKTYRVYDPQSPQYNFTTAAGEWKTFSFDYTVYDSEYGKAGEHAQSLKIELVPDGVNETPVYIDNIKVTETVTDFEIEKAELVAFSEGSYSYKTPTADKPFAIYSGEELLGEYDSWSEVLSAYTAGSTIKLQKNYVFTDADAFSSFDAFESVDIDMNGYVIYSENENNSLLWLKTTKTGNTTVNLRDGSVFLKNTPLVSYASSTTAGSGKEYDINLDNVNIILNEDFVSYNVMSDKTIASGVSVNTDITLTDCNIEAKNDAMETWDVTVFSSGDGSLTTNYIIKGGTFNIDFFKKITIYDAAENTTFCADDAGVYTILTTPANVIVQETSYKTDKGYRNFITDDTGDGIYTYTLEKTELSTLYGIIPTQYANTSLYPFAVFSANGEFVCATDNYGTGDTCALQQAKDTGDGAVILLRRDFDLKEIGTYANLSQVNGTLYIDLNGFTMNMLSDAYFMNAQAKTNNSTTVVVKNGTLRTKKTAFVKMASWANTAYTQKKEYVLNFENVTFGFAEGVSGLTNLITTAYTGGDDPESHVSINLNDCIIDLETNAPTGNYTLFNGIDSLNHIEADINIAGGKIVADSLSNATLSTLSGSNGSSLIISKGTEGAYPRLLVKQPEAGIFGDVIQTSEDGYKVFSANDTADENGYYECGLDGNIIATEYGAVSPEYAEKTFVAFSGGKAIFADDNFYNGIFDSAKEYLKGNPVNTDGSMGDNAQEIQVVMMKDHTMPDVVYVNLSQLKGKMTLDLGGNTLTLSNSVPMFNAQGKYWGTHGVFETEFLIKNGNIEIGNQGVISYHTWKYQYDGGVDKQYTFDFDSINFSIKSGSTPTSLVKFQSDTNDLAANYDISFNNCTFDLSKASTNITLFGANHESYSIISVNYKVTGGNVIASDMSKVTMSSFGNSIATIEFKPDEESGLYTTITLPSGAAAPSGDIVSGSKKLRYEKYAENTDDTVTYAAGVVTEYGAIPAQYADKAFIIFSDGEFKYASDDLYASGSDTTSAIYLAKEKILQSNKNLVNADGSLQEGAKEAQIVMTKDYTVQNTEYTNIAQVQGKVTIDLGGNTLSQYKSTKIFTTQAKPWWTVTDTHLVIKNGDIEVKNGPIIQYYTWRGSSYTGTAAKRYILDFENICFDVNGSAEQLVAYNTNDSKNLAADYDINFTGCTFDLTNAANKFTLCSAEHDINTTYPITVDYTLTGGEIIAKTDDSFDFAEFTGTGEASIEYATDDDGLYTTLTLPETAAAPAATVVIGGVTMLYTKASAADGKVTYKLVPAEYEIVSYDADAKTAQIIAEEDGTYVIAFAKYDGDSLVSVDIVTTSLTKGVNTVSQTLDFAADKIMLWQDIGTMIPLCAGLEN